MNFLVKALLAGITISIVAGPLGSLMIWRRMSYFGETLAHSTLLGASFALLINVNMYVGLLVICMLVAVMLSILSRQKNLATDAILGILSHTALAAGLIMATSINGIKIDLLSFLFGDILSINNSDLILILTVVVIVFCILARMWRLMLASTVQEDIAKVEGIKTDLVGLVFILLLAMVFAVAMKLIGVLLITALLIIPASSARQLADSPEKMAFLASLIGAACVCCGLLISINLDWPVGPAIVMCASAVFCLSFLYDSYKTRSR